MSRKRRPEPGPQHPTRMVELDVPGLAGVVITHSYGYDPERAVSTLVEMVRDERTRRAIDQAGAEGAQRKAGQAA